MILECLVQTLLRVVMCMASAHLSLLQKEYISSMAFRLERTGL